MIEELQQNIRTLLETAVAEGKEHGAQVVVYKDGKRVVDAWAGVADARTGRQVGPETLFPVFSTGKGVVATSMNLLAERGQIDYDTPIAKYWPEFAANGKEGVTVRHALTHTSGLPNMPEGIDRETICDWDFMCRAIAQMTPESAPGEKMVYHPITYGWILGEVVRRVDGRAVQPFVEQEIAGPLGLKTMFFGVPAPQEPGVAWLEEIFEAEPPAPAVDPTRGPLAEWMNRSDARRACIPGSSGIMNARAVARHYAALLPGGVDGVELLPPERVRLAVEEYVPGGGKEEGAARRGLGYMLDEGRSRSGFGHGGYGGSAGFGDLRHGLAVGVTRNRFSKHDLTGRVINRLRHEFGMG